MTIHHDPAYSGSRPRRLPSWRWLTEGVLWIEHAFERARADDRPEDNARVRIFVIMAAFSAVFACLVVGAAYAALVAPHAAGGVGARFGALARADIVDRNGQLLAANITHYGLYIDPTEVWNREAAFSQIRRALPEVSARRLRAALYGKPRVVVMNGLTPTQRSAVHALGLGGVSFEPEDKRLYPLGRSAAHVVGVVDAGGDALSGAERAFDREIRAAGAAGQPFALSIDMRVQGVLENELARAAAETGAKGAVGIITNVQTGEVLGMASWPFTGAKNQALAAHYEMGSVFKSFTVAASLDTGVASMGTLLDASQPLMVGNRRITDFHPKNRVLTLEEVYLFSSNIGTSRLALEMGPDVMRRYFERLGLLDRAPIELRESARPRVPTDWSNSTLASLSYGYAIMITPAQMAAAMGALTNGGRFIPLTLRAGGHVDPSRVRQVISPESSLTMLDLMRRNAVREGGSGSRADAPGLRVGGKSGSANKLVNGQYDRTFGVGSFAAVFPADGPVDAPRYQIFILIDEPSGGSRLGGAIAAPPVGRIADRIAPFLGVERRGDRWRTVTGEPTEWARANGAGRR